MVAGKRRLLVLQRDGTSVLTVWQAAAWPPTCFHWCLLPPPSPESCEGNTKGPDGHLSRVRNAVSWIIGEDTEFGEPTVLQPVVNTLPFVPERAIISYLKIALWKHNPEKCLGEVWPGPCFLSITSKNVQGHSGLVVTFPTGLVKGDDLNVYKL